MFLQSIILSHFYTLDILSNPTEAVAQRCSVKKVFLVISQNSQDHTYEFSEISKNTFFYRTPLVTAFGRTFKSLDTGTFKQTFTFSKSVIQKMGKDVKYIPS